MNNKKFKLIPKSKYSLKKKFEEENEKPIYIKKYLFVEIKEKGKIRYEDYYKYKQRKKEQSGKSSVKAKKKETVVSNSSLISSVNEPIEKKKKKVFKYLKDYYKEVTLPSEFAIKNNDSFHSGTSKIKIRKTSKSIEKATNPYSISEEGESIKYCLETIALKDIHPSKFIMLANGVCYDIELLVNYTINRYQSKENYNLEPQFQSDPIWSSKADIDKILNHSLIKNPKKLSPIDYLYGKKMYSDNVKIFKDIINEYDINKPYFNLFDKYPQFLIGMNRLGTIFHIEQPTSYFNLDNISFKDVDGLEDNDINAITDKLINIIKLEHMDKLTQVEIRDLSSLVSKIHNIITQYEYAYFIQLMEDLDIVLTDDQLNKIIQNIGHMLAFHINFNEGSQAKINYINYINKMDSHNKKLALSLVNEILTSDDCIHRQGNKLRYVFIKWWYKYLNHYNINNTEISKKYVPVTYGTDLNTKSVIKSPLLEKYNEDTHGYFPVKCPHRKTPSMYYKMGNICKWDGINLNTFTFCCRLNDAPY